MFHINRCLEKIIFFLFLAFLLKNTRHFYFFFLSFSNFSSFVITIFFMKLITILFAILFFNLANSAEGPPLKLSAGIGAITKNNLRFDNNYHRSDSDIIFTSIPFITLNYGPLNIGGGGINFSILGDRERSLYLNLNRQGENYYANNMAARFSSWFFGAGIKYYDFNFLITRDINGNSHGNKSTISYSKMHFINDYIYRTSLSVEYFNHQYSNYYYGVKANETTLNRSYYDSPSYFQFGISAMIIKKFIEKINLSMGLSIKNIPAKIKKSPTVKGTDFELTMINGLTWTFY